VASLGSRCQLADRALHFPLTEPDSFNKSSGLLRFRAKMRIHSRRSAFTSY
jgi:hypothetical protein